MVQMRRRPPSRAREAYVRDAEWLSSSMVRVVFEGEGLTGFPGRSFCDAYVKLVFVDSAVMRDLPGGPLDLDVLRSRLPPELAPRMRTYTVRAWDAESSTLTIDFVVHGDEGLAGPWAANAKPGERAFLLGPGGAYSPPARASFFLLAGDASAVPAIANVLEALPDDAVGQTLIEVHGPEDEFPIAHPDGVELHWLHLGGAGIGSLLVPAVRELDFATHGADAFVHGEAGFVKDLRRHLRSERGFAIGDLSVSGYWRVGMDDEGWRSAKRDWVAAVEADDRT